MKQLGILMAVGLLTSCTHMGKNELPSKRSDATRLRRFSQNMVIPDVDLNNATFEEAITFLVASGRENNHPSMSIMVRGPIKNKTGITIQGKNLSFFDVLDEICDQSDMNWKIAGIILIVNPDYAEQLKDSKPKEIDKNDPFATHNPQPKSTPNPSGPVQ